MKSKVEAEARKLEAPLKFGTVADYVGVSDPESWWRLWFDGASRNGGESAGVGCVLINLRGQIEVHVNQKVSPATCNEAEYQAAFMGIQRALRLGARKIKIFGESKLVIQQICGRFMVHAQNLLPCHTSVMTCFETV